ncbi:MAG TPA: hypothetical protein VMI31_06770 [Fimbriimonadaceae bacterium]|nr:hypothetical protein [Fimbriimonadaceae bacterium]
MPAKQITGHIEPGPGVQINPNPGGGPDGSPVPPDQTPPKTMLVTMRLNVTDPDQALKSLQQIASKEDGAAIQFDETAKNPDPEGAILFVPSAKEQDTEKLVGAIGDLVVSDTWTGSSADRMDRIESDATNRINELHIKRQELLVKYFDDAPQIRHIDEDSDRITKCLASLRAQKPGAKTAVIKIKFID